MHGNLSPVSFHGNTLFVVPVNEEPFTPMKPIVEGMGLDWRGQHAKITSNKDRWRMEMISIQLPGDVQAREALCLPVRKLPAWMASINPKKVREEVRSRVILYQNECDDALWAYWTKGRSQAQPEPVANLPLGPISPDQQQHIRNLVAARAKALPHGGGFPQIWERVKNRFGVARYQDIPAAQFEAVVEYLLKMEVKQEPKALPPAEEPDLRALAVANHRSYRPEMRVIEEAVMKAQAQLHVIMDAVRRAAHEADGSSITLDTSLAQKSSELVMNRAEVIRKELYELEGLAVLGFAGIATHLELKHARRRLRDIERESKGRFKAGEPLHVFR